jgi:hypothetical protein
LFRPEPEIVNSILRSLPFLAATLSLGCGSGIFGGATAARTGCLANDTAFPKYAMGFVSGNSQFEEYLIPSFTLQPNMTVEFWFKTSATGVQQELINIHGGGSNTNFQIYSTITDWISNTVPSGNCTGTTISANSDGALSINTNHHIALVWRASGTLNLYVDGVQQAAAPSSLQTCVSTGALRLGSTLTSASFLTGTMDEVRISSTERYTTASFSPPTGKFCPDSSTIFLAHFDNQTHTADYPSTGVTVTPSGIPPTFSLTPFW